jgi:long-chain acyl-CoA synthetase
MSVAISGGAEAEQAQEKPAQPGGATPTLLALLERSAYLFAQRPALLFKPGFRYQTWTYERLLDEARRVAALLQSRGLQKGERAIIWGPNCPQWVAAYFGCAFAGVIAVPLDMRSANDFVERVVLQTQPRLAFVSRLTPAAENFKIERLYFEELDGLCRGIDASVPESVVPDDLLEIMFTSGTTGDPKGVMLSHGNLMANLAASREHVPGEPSYRLLSILPLSHMFEQMGGLLLPLSAGASITYATSFQPAALIKVMNERRVNLMLVVPQVLDLFMNGIEREVERQGRERLWRMMRSVALRLPFSWRHLLFAAVHKRFGGHLAVFFTGGAPLNPELGLKWEALGVRVIQGYGATEASPAISSHTIKEPRYDSVGRPLPGVSVRIGDDGEILVRGPNIMRGYWQAPEQTASALQDGWYKTGDLGFLDRDGYLHIQGRKKDMIALPSGQKVFPEDIETPLRSDPAVVDAAVVGLPRSAGLEVYAVLILNDGASAADVVARVNQKLAGHQQIRGYSLWPDADFPRTHTLKVRKQVILDVLLGNSKLTQRVAAPIHARPLTDQLTDLLSSFSERKPEELQPEFTLGADLNLDSLRRVELLSLIEERLGVALDDSQVEGETTISDLRLLVSKDVRPSVASFPRWGCSFWCRPIRGLLQDALLFPALRGLYRVRVQNASALDGLARPAIFVANHNLFLDSAVLLKVLPRQLRKHLAIAAAAELWRNPLWAGVNPLLGNAFPFSREGSVRASLENLGRILDEGWSVLIYPEGRLTIGGPIQPFKNGIGILAVDAGVPVVPIRLVIKSTGFPSWLPWIRRGKLEVNFGKPLSFEATHSYIEAARTIEDAVHAL